MIFASYIKSLRRWFVTSQTGFSLQCAQWNQFVIHRSETASERASVISAVCFLSYIRHCFVVNTDRLRTFYNPLAGNITSFRRDEGSTLLRHILQVHAVEKWRETRDREHVIWFWTHWNIKPATRCSICRLCSPIISLVIKMSISSGWRRQTSP